MPYGFTQHQQDGFRMTGSEQMSFGIEVAKTWIGGSGGDALVSPSCFLEFDEPIPEVYVRMGAVTTPYDRRALLTVAVRKAMKGQLGLSGGEHRQSKAVL